MGAGVIPFAVHENNLYFLFQSTFSGRKMGYLIDFGGGLGMGEDFRETAIREFVEETETMYFSDDLLQASRIAEKVNDQIPVVDALFEKTLLDHPDWWCKRSPGKKVPPKQWKTFFVEFPYRDIDELNKEWKEDRDGRFKKRRKLTWVEVSDLLAIYENKPKKLWKRVRQLEYAPNVIRSIQHVKMQ
ncbi:MAG: NUDIX hydrolase [Candidatus Thiodiazotropha sp. (ex. Lucinoma kazani)]